MGIKRRAEDRRNGDRRRGTRAGPGRRRGDRRQVTAGLGVLTAVLIASAPAKSSAQIYTRTNKRGVVEATNFSERAGDYKLAYPKRLGVLIHSPGFRVLPSSHSAYDHFIAAAAALHNVEVALVRAVIQTESQFDPRAVSSVGAQGLMQLMPATARRFGVTDAFDPRQNIFGGTRYLRVLLDMFQGDVVLATAAYNAGESAVSRYGGVPPYRETQGYVRKIQVLLGGAPAVAPAQPALARSAAPPRPQPRTLYRWTDDKGVPHLTEDPPADGTEFVTLRSGD
jgi:soluble lytic murein transglycosylase-like protein